MAEIKDCIGKHVKISKNSITIKNEEGKTCGVVRNVSSLADIQPNKQMDYYKILKKLNLHGKLPLATYIIANNKMYAFRNIKSKLFHEKYGYLTEDERERAEQLEDVYNALSEGGIEVIECIYV